MTRTLRGKNNMPEEEIVPKPQREGGTARPGFDCWRPYWPMPICDDQKLNCKLGISFLLPKTAVNKKDQSKVVCMIFDCLMCTVYTCNSYYTPNHFSDRFERKRFWDRVKYLDINIFLKHVFLPKSKSPSPFSKLREDPVGLVGCRAGVASDGGGVYESRNNWLVSPAIDVKYLYCWGSREVGWYSKEMTYTTPQPGEYGPVMLRILKLLFLPKFAKNNVIR